MNPIIERPFTLVLIVAVALMMGSSVFASPEAKPLANAKPLSESASFKALSAELERDYQALFKLLDASVEKLAVAGQSPSAEADRRVSMAEEN